MMIRRFATCLVLLCFACLCASAQGLNTQASKDDWEEINFEFNSAVLSDGFPSLLRLADLLSKHPGFHVKVEGHTDNLGSSGFNDKLGLERANTVRDFLVKYGAKAEQVEVASRGASTPEVHGFKQHFSKTDVARWMNRRVVLTVTDEQGRTVSAGGAPEAIKAMTPEQGISNTCCADILKRLDKLDEIAQMLKDLAAQNANLKQQVADLQQKQGDLQNQVNGAPKPPTAEQNAAAVTKSIEENRDKRFSLLGLNAGTDTYDHDFTFNVRGRYFAPFKDNFAFEAQGEYDYYSAWREGELDFGLVNRVQAFQLGAFASFKNVDVAKTQNSGNLGQASITADYVFSTGKVGLFATKSFLDNPLINSANYVFTTEDSFGNVINRTAPNVYVEEYLHVDDQVGVSGTFGLWGDNYFEGNIGYLRRLGPGPHIGGSGRIVFPIAHSLAVTIEGDANSTMVGPSSWGQVLAGIQLGDIQHPKDYGKTDKPIPVDVPQIKWEQASRVVHRGASPPIANAGGNQIGVPAGTITLNGSKSYDPNGEALTYQWTVNGGGAASLANPAAAVTTFTAQAGASYSFTLTVTNTDGLSASANAIVTTLHAPANAQIQFCTAQPLSISPGQSTVLSWATTNSTLVSITPGVGTVANSGSVTVTPAQSTTYVVTATSASGSSSTCTIGVTVTQPGQNQGPQIVLFSANPGTISPGQSSTLTWQVNNATNISIAPAIGNVAANGSSGVTPAQTTTYTITASNQYATVSANVTVAVTSSGPPVVPPPVITSFTANPTSSPNPGTPIVLNCLATGTRPGGILISGYYPVDQNGNLTVYPQATTTYICVALNSVGTSVTRTLTVPVGSTPPAGSSAPKFNLPSQVQTLVPYYTINLTGTTSPSGSYPITYSTRVLGDAFDNVSNATGAMPTVNLIDYTNNVEVLITATDAKGVSSTFTMTIYYVGPPPP
jgi:hypothetical protein